MTNNDGLSAFPKRILLIASNPATSPITGWPIGFWWAELVHPWQALTEAGYNVTICSPKGGTLRGDRYSDPEDESGYSADDILSLGFKHSPKHHALIENTPALSQFSPDEFDAIMIAGGQGPMVTMIDDADLHAFVAQAYEAGKVVCVICHATCILLKTRLSSGQLLIEGKTWTGFANAEERYAEQAAGTKIQPFWIEDEAAKIENTNFITSVPFSSFAVRDGNLITGQQQHSGREAAEAIVSVLGR